MRPRGCSAIQGLCFAVTLALPPSVWLIGASLSSTGTLPRRAAVHAQEVVDPEAVELVGQLMAALRLEDEQAALRAVLPLVHRSLLDRTTSDLAPLVKGYSYKKARQNAAFYKFPIEITRVARGAPRTVGHGETAERGRTDRYFLAKREGIAGVPAPIHVFFPADGGPPKVIDMGSP